MITCKDIILYNQELFNTTKCFSRFRKFAEHIKDKYCHSVTIVSRKKLVYDNRLEFVAQKHLVINHYTKDNIKWTYHLVQKKEHGLEKCLLKRVFCLLYKKTETEYTPTQLENQNKLKKIINPVAELQEALQQWIKLKIPICGSLVVLWQVEYSETKESSFKTLFSKTFSNNTKKLTIVIQSKFVKANHYLCYRLYRTVANVLPDQDPALTCPCCGIESKNFNAQFHSVIPHNVSAITQLDALKFPSVSKWIELQHRLIQYVFIASDLTLKYMDCFEEENMLRSFDNWNDMITFSKNRHQSHGKYKKKSLLERTRQNLAKFTQGHKTGTAEKWKKQLDRAQKNMVLAIFDPNRQWSLIASILTLILGQKVSLIGSDHIGRLSGFSTKGMRIIAGNSLFESISDVSDFQNKMKILLTFLYDYFKLEIFSGQIFSLSLVAYRGIMYQMACNPLYFGLAKSSIGLVTMLRQKSLHQILFSKLPFLSTGEKMSPNHANFKTAVEMDMSLCYSSQVAKTKMPTGVPLCFTKENPRDVWLKRDNPIPHQSAELAIVYFIIGQVLKQPGITIYQVYHRFTPNGCWLVDKKSLDLLIVYGDDSGRWPIIKSKAVQIHHNYTHSCLRCPKLKKYARNLNYEEMKEYSNTIDAFWEDYCQKKFNCSLLIIYHCHSLNWADEMGTFYYQNAHEMRCSKEAPKMLHTITDFGTKSIHFNPLNIPKLLSDPSIIVYVIGEGEQGLINEDIGHIATKRLGKTILANKTFEPTLFFGPYLKWLIEERQFQFSKIYHIIIYKSTDSFQPIFQKLVDLRTEKQANLSQDAELLKFVLNSSIGMFGTCKTQDSKTTYFQNSFKPTSKMSTYDYRMADFGVFKVQRTYPKLGNTGLLYIVHMTIMQQYRLSMIQTMAAMQNIFDPFKFRILQCHADSYFIGLSEVCLEDCVTDFKNYEHNWKKYFKKQKTPGFFSITRICSGNFSLSIPGVKSIKIEQFKNEEETKNQRQKNYGQNCYFQLKEIYDNNIPYYISHQE